MQNHELTDDSGQTVEAYTQAGRSVAVSLYDICISIFRSFHSQINAAAAPAAVSYTTAVPSRGDISHVGSNGSRLLITACS